MVAITSIAKGFLAIVGFIAIIAIFIIGGFRLCGAFAWCIEEHPKASAIVAGVAIVASAVAVIAFS